MSESAGDKPEELPAPVEGTSNGTAEEQAPESNSTETAPPPAKPKYRHDWYQTESDVCINILIKKVKKENVEVEFQEKSVKVRIVVGEDDIYDLSLNLAHLVNVGKCVTKVFGTKVELRMRKCEAVHWGSLEKKEDAPAPKLKLPSDNVSTKTADSTPSEGVEEPVHKYPSSSHYTRDWDKLVAEVKKEEKEEKPEGDAALNKLFQQIYRDGSDEVKKAMNKSFSESGGTVLSTNWGDIGKGKVERKPPDGMEWREYEK